jgi:hypothetical protein
VRSEREDDADAIFAALTERVARLPSADMCGVWSTMNAAAPWRNHGLRAAVQVVRNYAIPCLKAAPSATSGSAIRAGLGRLAAEPLRKNALTLLINAAGMYNSSHAASGRQPRRGMIR